MDKSNLKKEYTNGEITIVWQSSKCIHAGNCVRNNPDVFHPKEKPWILPNASSTEKIISTIEKCPSEALSYFFNKQQLLENYETLSEAINDLKSKGYLEDFNLRQNCVECRNGEFKLFHDEFHIEKVIRFDVDTDPADQAVLYVISSDTYKLKGLLVNGYGIYSEDITNEMMEKLTLMN